MRRIFVGAGVGILLLLAVISVLTYGVARSSEKQLHTLTTQRILMQDYYESTFTNSDGDEVTVRTYRQSGETDEELWARHQARVAIAKGA